MQYYIQDRYSFLLTGGMGGPRSHACFEDPLWEGQVKETDMRIVVPDPLEFCTRVSPNFCVNKILILLGTCPHLSQANLFGGNRREVYRILQEEGIDLPRYAVLNRDPARPEGEYLA